MPINTDALMQVLGAAGAGLNPDAWVQNLNALVQSGYGSKKQFNLIDVFKQMLSGDMAEGKATIGKDGVSLKLPSTAGLVSEAFGGGKMGAPSGSTPKPFAEGLPGAQVPNVPAPSPNVNLPTLKGGLIYDQKTVGNLLNPSASQLDVSAADLAGLTPQDVSNALSGALNIEKFQQTKITDAADLLYKGALTKESIARAKELGEGDPLDQNFPIPHPEAGNLSLRQWQSLPTEEREFAAYVHAAKKIGAPKEELTRKFFSMLEPSDREQFLRAAMADPKLMTAAKELAKSGATRIGTDILVERKKEMLKLSGQEFFGKGKHVAGLQKRMDTEDVQNKIFMAETPEQADQIRAEEAVKYIESEIAGRGGVVVNVRFAEDNKTMIWTVKWPSGDTEEIKHAVRD